MKRRSAIIIAVSVAAIAILAAIYAIAADNLNVLWPNGGETLYKGYMYKLRWEDSREDEFKPEYIRISVYDGNTGGPYYFLDPMDTDNDGEYWWQVPAVEEWSNNCYFRVEDTPTYPYAPQEDESDDGFTIRYLGPYP
ncbi:MAG: hypothetical protein ACE5JA_02315 [bacterium]